MTRISAVVRRATIVALGGVLFASGNGALAQTLSGITLLSTDEFGSEEGFQYWDTRPDPNGFFDLWVVRGVPGGTPDSLSGAFLNGPGGNQVPINLALQPGTNQFTIFAEPGPIMSHHGMNLFFNGHVPPDISVKAPNWTEGFAPAFSANGGARTINADGDLVPGSGTLIFQDGNTRIELTDFFWAAPPLFEMDRVSAYDTSSNGLGDFVGSFTLVVSGTVPPAPTISVATYAGITISGQPGSTCRIESAPALAQPPEWKALAEFTLPASPYLWIDLASTNASTRIYRAIALP